MYWKTNFNKIKQGCSGIVSDLDVTKACEVIQIPGMIMSKQEIIMSHVSQWPMRGLEMQLPWLSNQWGIGKNVLGWCMGDEVKNFGKDIMETQSSEYGFILYWPECRIDWIREATSWIRVSCVMENVLSIVFWLFFLFVAMKKKKRRAGKVSHVSYYFSWCNLSLRWHVENVVGNQYFFIL